MNRDWSKERAILNRVRNRVQKALDEVLSDPLMVGDLKDLKLGKIKFDDEGFRAQIDGVFKGKQSREERTYEDLRRILAIPTRIHAVEGVSEIPGLQLPPLGTYVTPNGRGTVRVIGARDTRAKFNIICLRGDGERVFYRDEDIARLAKKQGVA